MTALLSSILHELERMHREAESISAAYHRQATTRDPEPNPARNLQIAYYTGRESALGDAITLLAGGIEATDRAIAKLASKPDKVSRR